MSYKYAEVEFIKARLIGRLYFEDSSLPTTGTGVTTGGTSDRCPVGAKKVNSGLFDRIIKQKEVMLENYLNMIYVTPLKLTSDNTRLILAEIVEHLVVAELMPIYYRGGQVPQTGVDPSSLAGSSAKTAGELIQVYITGHNMYIPGVNSQPNMPRGPIPQPVVLPGECLRDGFNQPDTVSRSEGYVGSYSNTPTPTNDLFDFSCI